MDGTTDASDPDPDCERLLSVLGDPDCRAILRELDGPTTAKELMATCDLSQTTTYRKLDDLSETALVDERTELRDDGHHTTRYVRAVEGVYVDVDDDPFDVRLAGSTDGQTSDGDRPDERLAWLWSEVGEEL